MSPPSMPESTDAEQFAGHSEDHNRRRRVTLVIPMLVGGGAERVVCALAKHWSLAGHDVTVITIGSRDTDAYSLVPGVGRIALDLVRPSQGLLDASSQTAHRLFALRRAIGRAHPDVLVSFLPTTNVLSLLAACGRSLPVIVCERSDPRHERIGTSWSVLRRSLYPRAARVVVQTAGVAAWAREFCPRVEVIRNFVERPPRTASPGTERGPWRLIGMGRLEPEKGFDLLIEAFASVAEAHPEWSLTILGEGRERPRLEALVASLRLQRRVSLPGRAAEPLPILADAHAFALSSRLEGFPNALLEAMACGLPAVAFDCASGPSDIITHEQDGLLVPSGDVTRLAAALERIMAHPAERARLGRNAQDVAVVLAPERILAEWDALLRDARA